MPDRMVIGQRLKTLRGTKTLEEVAQALGVSSMAVSLWERGERVPSDAMKVKIANYYNTTVYSIFFEV